MSSIANAHNGTQQNEVESLSLDSWGSIFQFFVTGLFISC